MYPYQIAKSAFSFSKIIGGLSRTLSIANQLIPLYKQAMPMIKNARTILSALKIAQEPDSNSSTTTPTNETSVVSTQSQQKTSSLPISQPKFFL